jgi:hypothetical protein
MKSNVRRTFRPTLEALESRLVPSWSFGTHGNAVLTVAQPVPASPPAVGLTLPDGPTTVLTAALGDHIKKAELTLPAAPTTVVTAAGFGQIKIEYIQSTTPARFSEVVVTGTPSIILKRVGGDAQPVETISLNFTKVE